MRGERTGLMGMTSGDEGLEGRTSRRDFLWRAVKIAGGIALAGYGGSAAEALAAADPRPSGASVKLTQWYHQYGEAGTEQAVMRYAKQYTQKNKNVEINVVWVPGDYGSKLSSALLTSNGPDIYESIPNYQMVRQHQVTPLDSIYSAAIKKDYNPVDIKEMTIGKHIYGVKMVDDVGLLYYRPSLLKKAGIKPPQTGPEVLTAAKKLTQGNVKGLFLGNDGGISAMETVLPWSNGVEFLRGNNVVFNNNQAAEAYSLLAKLNKENVLLLGAPTDWFDPSAFNQGLTAMAWGGLWAMPATQKALGKDFGVMPWPKFGSKGKPATFLGGWAEMVNGKSKHIAEAKKFVQWLWIQNKADITDFNLSYGFHVPPRKSVASHATKLKSGQAHQAVQIFNKYAQAMPATWDGAMDTALIDAISQIVKNGADPHKQLSKAAQKVKSELKKEMS